MSGRRHLRAVSGPGPNLALSARQRADLRRAMRVARVLGLLLPLASFTAAIIMVLVWMPRIPNPAATHWSGGGPNGFGSPWTYVWLPVLAGYGIATLMWMIVAYSGRMPAASPKRVLPVWSGYHRFLTAFAFGYAVFFTITILASVGAQLDLDDAHDAPDIGGAMLLAFGAWVLATGLAWLVQPRVEIPRDPVLESEPLPLAESERAVWLGEVRPAKGLLWLIGSTVLVLAAATVLVFLAPFEPDERGAVVVTRIVMLFVLLLVVVLFSTTVWFRVRIDEHGLEARSVLGWPVIRLSASEVQSVEAAEVNPLAEFGGWGLRWVPGRFGILMRTGEALIATRGDGRIFAITLDDAETAAAVLAAAAQRAAGGKADDECRTENDAERGQA